jgi:Helix-turn-helix domain
MTTPVDHIFPFEVCPARRPDLPIDPEYFYKPQEVAAGLRCSKTDVYDLMKVGKLARLHLGVGKSGFRVRGRDLINFIENNTEGGRPPKMNFKYLRNR